jgi:hypothetical protein
MEGGEEAQAREGREQTEAREGGEEEAGEVDAYPLKGIGGDVTLWGGGGGSGTE